MLPCSTSMPRPVLSPSSPRPTTKLLPMPAATTSMTSTLRRPMAPTPPPRPWPSRSPMSMKRRQLRPAATASFAENGTGTVYTAAATDPDAGTTLTYSISGADASLFNINATTGAVTFKSSPNYEAPGRCRRQQCLRHHGQASDGTNTATKAVAITVTNVNEAPTVTSAATASFAENASGTVYTVAATDPDAGTTLTYSLSGADASLFNINATTGVVTFKSSPNYEAPTDAGGNNVYDINVRCFRWHQQYHTRPWPSRSPMSMRRQQSRPLQRPALPRMERGLSTRLRPPILMPEQR